MARPNLHPLRENRLIMPRDNADILAEFQQFLEMKRAKAAKNDDDTEMVEIWKGDTGARVPAYRARDFLAELGCDVSDFDDDDTDESDDNDSDAGGMPQRRSHGPQSRHVTRNNPAGDKE